MEFRPDSIMVVHERRRTGVILENLAVVRSVLYTGIVALWFMGACQSYKKLNSKKLITALQKAATKEE